jgi:Ca2+-binding RTX toxin-like protein
MSSTTLRAAALSLVPLAGLLVLDGPATAAPTCFGKPATIVGSGLIEGTSRNDVIVATASGSEVHGGPGDDRICGAFIVLGDVGDDRIRFEGHQISGLLHGGRGDDYIEWASASDGIPELYGGAGNDRLVASGAGSQILVAGSGDDVVLAGPGDDWVYGKGGADLLRSGTGNDLTGGGAGDDRIYGGAGRDDITGGLGRDVAYAGRGRDSCSGVERPTSCRVIR